jgi:hypothetical protein
MGTERNRHPIELALQQFGDDRHPATAASENDRDEVARLHASGVQDATGHGHTLPKCWPDK